MKILSFCRLVLPLIFALVSVSHASIGGYFSTADRTKFRQILTKALEVNGEDLITPYYAVRGLRILTVPFDKKQILDNCANIKKHYKYQNNENTFYAFSVWALLRCEGDIHTPTDVKKIQSSLENEKTTLSDIRYGLEVLTALKENIPNPAGIAQTVQAKLKEDDSLQNLGQSLHIAALLKDNGKFALDRVEDIIVQADEIDGKLLQWEGGLSITSLLLTGLLRLPDAKPLTTTQADKFANYLLTRKTVQTPKGVFALLDASHTLALTDDIAPVSISILGTPYVSLDKPELKIQVSNLFGVTMRKPLSPVQAESVVKLSDNSVVLSKQDLKRGVPTEFILPLSLDPGLYKVVIKAGTHSAEFVIRALGTLTVKSLEIGLSEADSGTAVKLTKLPFKKQLDKSLQADSSQTLIVKFSISRPVHQAFLRLYDDKKEIIFVAEQDSSKIYLVEVNLEKEISKSGSFSMEIILGDVLISNPVRWVLGNIDVSLGPSSGKETTRVIRGPKPEIKHLFRPAEKRPPEIVSLFFTAITAAPFLALLLLWAKVGINFNNFTALAIPFHLGFGAILGLFTLFWLKLDMFVTCAWLVPIGGLTFFSGHKLLSNLARNRKQEKADK